MKNARWSRWSLVYIGLAFVLLVNGPVRANLFGGLKHVDPTPPPKNGWNFVSSKFEPLSYPDVNQLSVVARCRYVAPQMPYQWQFEFTNTTSKPLKFRVGLVQINNQAFVTVKQHFSKVEPTSIQTVGVAPRRTSAIVEDGRYGCPGMPGGVNKDKHYVVMLDDLSVGSQIVSSGVFDRYDREIDDEHRQYIDDNNQRVGEAAAAGMRDGFDFISHFPDYEVPQTGGE